MKKQYIEPSTAVYTFSVAHIVAESVAEMTGDESPAEPKTDEEREGLGGGDGDARFGGGTSIWDNAW